MKRSLLLLLALAGLAALLAGCQNSTSNLQPVAVITASPTSSSSTSLPLTVTFDAGNSFAGSGSITQYAWVVDGAHLTGKSVQHTFSTAGTYVVKLSITTSSGAGASTSINYVVPAPALFTVTPTNLEGVTSAQVKITASGRWTLSSDQPWVTFSPASGSGSATATLTVNPTPSPADTYAVTVSLTANGATESHTISFAYPSLSGVIAKGTAPQPTSVQSQSVTAQSVATRRVARPQMVGPFTSSAGRLIVGVARPGQVKTQGQLHALAVVQELATHVPGLRLHSSFAQAGLVTVDVPDQRAAAQRLAGTPGVRYVEVPKPVKRLAVNDPYYGKQWALPDIGVPNAWTLSKGQGVRIAIIDSGFDPTHPDLADRVSYTYDFGDGTSNVMVSNSECGTHGTHVAGLAAATANNAIGIAGVAPQASLMLLDVDTSSKVGCPIYTDAMISALQYVTGTSTSGRRADVVNMSLGYPLNAPSDDPAMQSAVDAARAAGIELVAAAGNNSTAQSPSPVLYPAAFGSVLAVAATGMSNEHAAYSDEGSQLFISAPGGNALQTGIYQDQLFSTVYDFQTLSPSYEYMEGTSMASPVVAGVVALMRAANPSATPADLDQALSSTAQDLGATGKDDVYGYGEIDAQAAVNAIVGITGGSTSPSDLVIQVNGGPEVRANLDGSFTLRNLPIGSDNLTYGTDATGQGIGSASSDWCGTQTVQVAFDQPIQVKPFSTAQGSCLAQ